MKKYIHLQQYVAVKEVQKNTLPLVELPSIFSRAHFSSLISTHLKSCSNETMLKNLPVTQKIRQTVPDIIYSVRSNSLCLNFISVAYLDVTNQAYVMKRSQYTLMFPDLLHQ